MFTKKIDGNEKRGEKFKVVRPTEINPSPILPRGAFLHVSSSSPFKKIKEAPEEIMQQYKLKNPFKMANKILNREFVKEIGFYHISGIQGATLFRIGEKNNIYHFPENVKGQTITRGDFRKYFLISVNNGIKIRIVEWVPIKRRWENCLVISIPKEDMLGTAIIRRERVLFEERYSTSLIIPCLAFTPHFIFKEDIFEKYKRYNKIYNT